MTAEKYVRIVKDIVEACRNSDALFGNENFSGSNVMISEKALSQAIEEIRLDVEILVLRRNHRPLSFGKFAGIASFRLSRWNIISVKEPLLENTHALRLNYFAALSFAMKYCINIDISRLPTNISKELQFTIARRHTNQETLGICLDVIHNFFQSPQQN